MLPMQRRQFLLSSLALAATRSSVADTVAIEVLPDEPIGSISPNLYGHFTEHIGGCVYGGVWVGENSKIPNINGIRKELITYLQELNPPVIRWPGGCFADSYDWHDGVGPRKQRPRRTNFWANTPYLEKTPDGPRKYDPNEFGTNEFAHFCRLAGAAPYFAGNVRSLTPHDFDEWIEYCNSPAGTTSLADLRAAGGDREPFNVRYWGVGNESWGCGGSFTGDEYAVEFRRFIEWAPRFGLPLSFIASGPNVADYAWTRSFFTKLTEKSKRPLENVFGTALHYYCGTSGKGQSVDFADEDWYTVLGKANRMEELIRNHWQIMGEVDTEHRVKLVVDEWGAWHQTDPSIDPSYLFCYYPTLRDALVSGITLDIFNRNADKVAMANAAQLINNLHTSFLAVEDRFTVTPIYHVFRMYKDHQGATSVRTFIPSDGLPSKASAGLPALSGSCSIKGKRAVLTVVNSDIKAPRQAALHFHGARITGMRATVLSSTDIHAHNTFDSPAAVKPGPEKQVAVSGSPGYEFAPASVTKLVIDLA